MSARHSVACRQGHDMKLAQQSAVLKIVFSFGGRGGVSSLCCAVKGKCGVGGGKEERGDR